MQVLVIRLVQTILRKDKRLSRMIGSQIPFKNVQLTQELLRPNCESIIYTSVLNQFKTADSTERFVHKFLMYRMIHLQIPISNTELLFLLLLYNNPSAGTAFRTN